MKSLDAILTERLELKMVLSSFREKRDSFRTKWVELSDEQKKDYSHTMQVIYGLEVQIDALTYVINYDSKLRDVTKKPVWQHT